MYHPVRKKMTKIIASAILVLIIIYPLVILTEPIKNAKQSPHNAEADENFDNNIIDFDEDYSIKFNKKNGMIPWHGSDNFNKEKHRYTIINDSDNKHVNINTNNNFTQVKHNETVTKNNEEVQNRKEDTTTQDYSIIPLELISTTENILLSIIESTAEPDLTVIPLSTTEKVPKMYINETVTLPASTENIDTIDTTTENSVTTEELKLTVIPISITIEPKTLESTTLSKKLRYSESTTFVTSTDNIEVSTEITKFFDETTHIDHPSTPAQVIDYFSTLSPNHLKSDKNFTNHSISTREFLNNTQNIPSNDTQFELLNTNVTKKQENISRSDLDSTELDTDVPIFTELDAEDQSDVPEDYYDNKDVVPITAPRNDALSVIFGLAGSVVESVVETVAERVVPKSIFDLFKRMQKQNEALEAEKLRSPEENGGLGQFTRGIIKSISTGISKPLSQLMAGVRDIGSLDTDRGFVSSLASGVTSVANVANSVVDTFKDRVQAIYPGTVWCGDGRSASARSSDLGLFFFTDTCCRQHDACKLYIRAGETKYGLTNTGLFTRSHCSCDLKFRECLRRTSSLVSAQIGLTYFNVLGPQCFRRAHPIVRCVRRTRITGLKCEEYELDFTKSRMWQWFDNETF